LRPITKDLPENFFGRSSAMPASTAGSSISDAWFFLLLLAAHIAVLSEVALELERGIQVVWSVNELVLHCPIEVVLQHWTVFRVCNRNDALNALTWSQATQVSYTVLGDDDHGVVLSVVNVGSERNNRRNSAVLSNRWGHEGGDVAVTGKVTRTTGAVHDAG